VRVAGAGEVLPLAVAFYAEGGFATPVEGLRANLGVLVSSAAARVAVAVDGDEVVGFAVTSTGFGLEDGLIAELQDLFVVPARRGGGVGRALVEDGVGWARSVGCRQVELVVTAGGRGLVGMYGRWGFVDGGRRLLVRVV
jgi:aminoglycoside 6'-N-acetyltransferase I